MERKEDVPSSPPGPTPLTKFDPAGSQKEGGSEDSAGIRGSIKPGSATSRGVGGAIELGSEKKISKSHQRTGSIRPMA